MCRFFSFLCLILVIIGIGNWPFLSMFEHSGPLGFLLTVGVSFGAIVACLFGIINGSDYPDHYH